MAERPDVLVIGGGLAGISAALELQRLGRRVLVIEQGASLGGKANSTDTKVGSFPTGPTSFNGRYPAFWRLFDLLGISDEATKLRPVSSSRFKGQTGLKFPQASRKTPSCSPSATLASHRIRPSRPGPAGLL